MGSAAPPICACARTGTAAAALTRLATKCCCRSRDCLRGLGSYYALAVPSTLMVCLEWWAFEATIFVAGWLPGPTLAVAAMGTMMQVSGCAYMLPMVRGQGGG